MTTYASPAVKTNRPNLVAVGTIVWLSSELMFFAALFATPAIRAAESGAG
jgi:cytochrome c oxidase subunit 3